MWFNTDTQFYNDKISVEILSLTNITDYNDVSVNYRYYNNENTANYMYNSYFYLAADITHINGDDIQIKTKISLNTGEYKIYEINIKFIDISTKELFYITDNIREANNLPNVLMKKR